MDGADPPAGDDDGAAADVAAAADGSLARFRNALSDVVSPREAALVGAVATDLRGRARDVRELASSPPGEILGALRRSVAGTVAAARPGGSSSRLAVTLSLLVVASVTLTLVGTAPAAAILGDNDRTTYTLDVGEIQLDEGGQICATPVGDDGYRVLITDATLVDTTVYQQRGDDAVKTDLPTLEVDDAIVMYTSGEDEDFDLLATTMGCTDEDQTSRTVFRNRYQSGSMLHGSEGLTMVNMQTTDGAVPEPGGFQFVAPDENGSSSPMNVTGGVEPIADDVGDVVDGSLADRLENGTDGGLGPNETVEGVNETAGNATDGPAGADAVENATNATNATGEAVSTVGETVTNTTTDTVENTTREVADGDTPENVSGTVDETTDVVDTTTGEVENTTDDVTDATDEAADSTGDETTSTVVDETTDVVDGTTDTVTDTTDTVTDGVDETTDQVVRPVEETATPESTETSEPTPSPTEAPVTPTEVLTSTETPEDETPAWLDQVDDDERTSVLETIEETDGGFESVEDVTEETDGYSEESIDGDENLTRLDNGTVLLLNGTDADLLDWGTVEDTLDTDLTSTEDSETEATTSETDDGSDSDDGGTLFG